MNHSNILDDMGYKTSGVSIKYRSAMIGEKKRIILESPFAAKDAIKESMVARWEEKRKAWSIPFTRLAVKKVVAAIDKRHKASHTFEEDIKILVGGPSSIDDVKLGAFNGAVFTPWDHQRLGSSMIGNLEGCMLAWDMGSGKTKAVFDSIVEYDFKTVIVCCPTSVVSVWQKQFYIHISEKERENTVLLALREKSIDRRAAELSAAHDKYVVVGKKRLIVVINFEAAWREAFAKVVKSIDWDLAVADESHRIANHTTRVCKFMSDVLAPKAKHRVCLSGTPMGNGPIDAFGQFMFAEPALFGQSLTRFKAEYCIMGGFEGRQIVQYRNLDNFKSLMGSITSRVKLADVVQLPEYVDEEVEVTMCKEANQMYADLRDNFISLHKEGIITAANAITKLLRLQQMTSGYAMLTDEEDETRAVEVDKGKSEALTDIVEGIAKDEPVVVFCRFVRDLNEVHRIASELGRPSYEISGRVNQQKEWESECDLGCGPVIAVQIQAGGVGIDLTKSRYCVYYSLGFSLTDYEQSRARVYRPGQKRSVFYYHLIVPGTVDRSVYTALKDKRKVVDAVIEELTVKGF